MDEVIDRNKFLNSKIYKTYDSQEDVFQINDILASKVDKVAKKVAEVDKFSKDINDSEDFANYMNPIEMIVACAIFASLLHHTLKYKSKRSQLLMYFLATFQLSYLLIILGSFYSNLTKLNDVCDAMIVFNYHQVSPPNGFGIAKFFGCTASGSFYRQLFSNLQAQNAALKQFNNELSKVHLQGVSTIEEAEELQRILSRLEASNEHIDQFAFILTFNAETLQLLFKINNCNLFKSWMQSSQRKLCLNGQRNLLSIYYLYWAVIVLMVVLTVLGNRGYFLIEKMILRNEIKKVVFSKERFANDFKVE